MHAIVYYNVSILSYIALFTQIPARSLYYAIYILLFADVHSADKGTTAFN